MRPALLPPSHRENGAKEGEMKAHAKHLWAAGLVAAFVAAAMPARAGQLTCDVPFGFYVDGKALPAGKYVVSADDSVLLVRGAAEAALTLTNAVQSQRHSGVQLVFHKYGDRYVLRQAWTSDHSGRALRESAVEREMKLRAANVAVLVTVPLS
jgi:hypothetical protein